METLNATREKSKISVKDLNFYYGNFHALKAINLEIPENKVTAFIGPSGCGKSTLLRVFNRMFELYPEQRAEGQIMLDGENLLTSKGHKSIPASPCRIKFAMARPAPPEAAIPAVKPQATKKLSVPGASPMTGSPSADTGMGPLITV